MLTKTGLRPRETSGRGGHTNASFANRSLAHVYLGGQHPFATAATPSARRHLTPTRPPTTSGSSRRGQLRSPSLGRVRAGKVAQKPRSANALRVKRNGSGGRTRGDGISGGRGRRSGRSCSPDLYRRASPKPAWDDSLRDLSQFRLTPEEMIRRKQSFVSRHNTLASERGGGDGGRREHPRTPTPKQARPAAGKPRSHGRRHSGGTILTDRFASQEELRAPVETSTISTEKESVELTGASDVTAPLELSQGGNGATEGREERTKGAASDRAPGESDGLGKHHAGGSIGADEGHAGVFADDVVDSLGLAGIKEGIEAFTKRVCRLESDTKASFAAAMVGGEDEHEGETNREREPNLMLRGGQQGCGGDDTTDLVKRIQLLEEHVLQLRPPAPISLASSPEQARKGKTENCDDAESVADDDEDSARGPRNARRRGKEKGATMKESSIDDLRVVIAELLSLLALLLNRATNAEDRLRKITTDEPGNATVESSEGTPLDGGGDDRRGLFPACAESIAWAGGGNTPAREKNEEVCSRPLSSSSQCDDVVEPSASGEAYSYAAREDYSSEISPIPFPELRFGSGNVSREQIAHESTQPTKSTPLGSPAKDLWVEALDAVGQLVGGVDEGDEAPVEALDLRSSTSSNRFREAKRPARLTPLTTTFAAPVLTATGDTTSLSHSTDDSDAMEPRAAPRPLPRAAGVSSRRWREAREVLAPIPMSALPSYHGNSTSSGHYARPSLFGDSGEEDAGLGPLAQMPTPTKKPQHPFERLPPMRPSWQRQDAGNAGWTHLPAPSLTVGDAAYRRGADAFGDVDFGARGSAEPPAIGQWYTPTF
ncbi:unnamed protein product [Ascophyllum nodosum]